MGVELARFGVTIEIVPVVPSKDTVEVVGPRLDRGFDLLT
jgi:hypothetical protein